MNELLIKALIALGIIAYVAEAIPSKKDIKVASLNRDFYLEVSGRRSGKTTRLIEDMCKYIDNTGRKVCLITIARGKYILERIPKVYHKYILTNLVDTKYRLYYDEVDLMCANGKFLIRDNAYYVGTPGIEGRLKKLAQIKGEYQKHKTGIHIDNIAHYKREMDSKQFSREILGEFA